MKDIITGREELLLAKLAGEDVSLSTMTPPVAMNRKEKLLLDIAERLDGFSTGSGSGNGETTAGSGATVVTLTQDNGVWTSDTEVADIVATFNNGTQVLIFVESAGIMAPVMYATEDGNNDYVIVAPATSIYEDAVAGKAYVSYAIALYGSGGWELSTSDGQADISSFSVIPVNATVGESGGKQTFTFSTMSASYAHDAIASGKKFKVSASIGDDTIEAIFHVEAVKLVHNGAATYSFRFVSEYGKGYSVSNLSGSDTVVMTEE